MAAHSYCIHVQEPSIFSMQQTQLQLAIAIVRFYFKIIAIASLASYIISYIGCVAAHAAFIL